MGNDDVGKEAGLETTKRRPPSAGRREEKSAKLDEAPATSDPPSKEYDESKGNIDVVSSVAGGRHVICISSNLPEEMVLYRAIRDNVGVVLYDYNKATFKELLTRIKAVLPKGETVFDSIAFIDHGTPGEFCLINKFDVDCASLAEGSETSAFFASVGELLTKEGRLDLLACDLASEQKGKDLVDQLKVVIGNRSVAASDDLTGLGSMGGDFELEYGAGNEGGGVKLSEVYFNAYRLKKWKHTAGRLLDILKNKKKKDNGIRVLFLGLDNAGKTSIVKKLSGEGISNIVPTQGSYCKTIMQGSSKLNTWDIGGHKTIRQYWRNYYYGTNVLVYVVDSFDKERIEESREALFDLLREDLLSSVPVLIFLNKQDVSGALTAKEMATSWDLTVETTRGREWEFQACSVITGDGLAKGIQWAIEKANKTE